MSKSKRKLLISMLVAMFVLLSAVAIVAIAFALTQQTITTTLTIGYTVEDIDGSVYATYKIGNGEEKYLIPTGADNDHINNNSLVFKAEDKGNAGSLQFPTGDQTVALDSKNDNIVLKYTYSNTGGKHYIASMSFASNVTTNNMEIQYSTDGETYSADRYAVVVPAETDNKSYWIKISIVDKAKGASFSGDFKWVLKGYDKKVVGTDLYESLTALEFSGSNGSYSASVTSAGSGQDGNIVFPSAVNGDPVTTIVENLTLSDDEKASITSVYIPDSVTEIKARAFNGFKQLKTVTFEQNENTQSISTGLTILGESAFANCQRLSNFQIPKTVTTIKGWCFANNYALTSIKLPASLTSVGVAAFAGCKTLTDLTIEDNDIYACEGNCVIEKATNTLVVAAESVTVPNYVVTIYSYSLGYLFNTSITIPSSVTTIKPNAFAGTSTKLESVTFENKSNWSIAGADLTSAQIEEDLADTMLAATYLSSTYVGQTWTRG